MLSNRAELLRRAAERGKYRRLYLHLRNLTGDQWETTFSDIENILGFTLPSSARVHRPWWSNQGEKGGHSHALAWETAGWKTSGVDMPRERLVFVRHTIA